MSSFPRSSNNFSSTSSFLVELSIFSKVAYAEPLHNKTTEEVAKGLKGILKKYNCIPTVITSDDGNEWKDEVEKIFTKTIFIIKWQ